MPIGTNYLVRFSHVDPTNGLPVYLTKDGEETYTWDLQDRVAVGNVMPDAIGGLTNTFNYKNLEFSFLVSLERGCIVNSLGEDCLQV